MKPPGPHRKAGSGGLGAASESSSGTAEGNPQMRIRVALPRGEDPALLEVWLPRTEEFESRLRSVLASLPARTTGTFVVHTDRCTVAHAKLFASDGSTLSQHGAMEVLGALRERLTRGASGDSRLGSEP